jgi:hypothetical protein
MHKMILTTLAAAALIVALSTVASASPATRLLDPSTTAKASVVHPAYYYWNHRRYRHRSWDKRHRRWRYY